MGRVLSLLRSSGVWAVALVAAAFVGRELIPRDRELPQPPQQVTTPPAQEAPKSKEDVTVDSLDCEPS